MTWFPAGPDTIMSPKSGLARWRRVSRRNEFGEQAAIFGIAVGATEGDLTVIARRVGGSSVFRSRDDGRTWRCVSDDLNRTEPGNQFFCVAVRPRLPELILLGTAGGLRVSLDGGGRWLTPSTAPIGAMTELRVDEFHSGTTWETTVLYAGTSLGVTRSGDGGQTWQLDAIGRVDSLAIDPRGTAGRPRFYAGVLRRGLVFAESVGSGASAWRTLNGPGGENGLPAAEPSFGYVYTALVDIHEQQPERVYALLVQLQDRDFSSAAVQGLYVTVSERVTGGRLERTWEPRALAGPPDSPGRPPVDTRLDGARFIVAPENSGPDTEDVLLCTGGVFPWRGVRGGRSWQGITGNATLGHVDLRSFAFFPPATAFRDGLPPGVSRPRVYLGSDGGLAANRHLTDPAYNVTASSTSPARYNEGELYDATNTASENLSRGFAAVAGFQIGNAGNPRDTAAVSTLAYISTLDTGTSRLITSRTARAVGGGDAGPTFIAAVPEGVRIWQNASMGGGWAFFPYWNFVTYLDTDGRTGTGLARVMSNGQPTGATSNLSPDTPGAFFAGILTRESFWTLASDVPASPDGQWRPVTFTITPGPGAPALAENQSVWIGADLRTIEETRARSVGPGSFVASSLIAHAAGEPVFVTRYGAARVTDTTATRLGESFASTDLRFTRVVRAGSFLYGCTANQRLWRIDVTTASPTTPWAEIAGRPDGLAARSTDGPNYDLSGMLYSGLEYQPGTAAIVSQLLNAADGAVYALLSGPATPSMGGARSALWRIDSGAWTPEACVPPVEAATPEQGLGGVAVAHPDDSDRFFCSRQQRVYEVRRVAGTWNWSEFSENLVGQEIHDLHVANLSRPGEPPRYLLRALAGVRGIWEREIDPAPRGVHLFHFRKHVFDRGWTGAVIDGLENPLRPGERAWHWQSPDIKVDAPDERAASGFYQTEAEATLPCPGEFSWILDRSDSARAGQALRVFVRVNNRSIVPSGEVKVWAISCAWSAGVPALPATARGGDFWTRFHADGSLDTTIAGTVWTPLQPRLPMASAWFPVSGVASESPAIAAFDLEVGSVAEHRCVLVFVHGPDAVLDGRGLTASADDAVLRHPQVAQRNLSIDDPLPADPGELPPPAPPTTTGMGGTGRPAVDRTIQFHNFTAETTVATVRFLGSALPPAMTLSLRLEQRYAAARLSGGRFRSAGKLRGVFDWLVRILAWLLALLGIRRAAAPGNSRTFGPWFDAKPGSDAVLTQLELPPFGSCTAEISVSARGPLDPGSEPRLDIVQETGKTLGGATLLLPVAGDPSRDKPLRFDEEEREHAALHTRPSG